MPFIFDLDTITPISDTNSGGSTSTGTTNYNQLTNKPSINGVTLLGNKTSEDLGISGITEDFVNLSIVNHNTNNQSHNDIRNNIIQLTNAIDDKADLEHVNDIDGRLVLAEEDIDVLNQQIGYFTSVAQNSAIKNEKNTFTERNTFTKNVVIDVEDPATSDESGIILASNNRIVSGTNNKVILQDKKDENDKQSTYIGGDFIEIYSPDGISVQTTGDFVVKRGNYTDGWNNYINIDSGNINNYISNNLTNETTVLNDRYGIEADYAVHYGILDCPNGLINYSFNHKEIEIQPSVVLQLAGQTTKTLVASTIKYEIEETGKVTLFFTKTESESGTSQLGFIEAGNVFYQEEEPTNGTTSFIAWWKPSLGLWQFKSNYTGNVWRTAIATPIANINASNTGITSVNYIGYRIIDDDIFAQLSDIDAVEDKISTINDNITFMQASIDEFYDALDSKQSELLPRQLLTGAIPSVSDLAEDADLSTIITSFNNLLAQLRLRNVIS